jgi:hypothetical protein
MERMLKIFSMALLVSTAAVIAEDKCCEMPCCNATCCDVSPYIYNRSVSENAARELAGWTGHVNLADMDRHYGSFSVTPEYTRSFYPGKIANRLFNCDLNNSCGIDISGSAVENRDADKHWLADYFYLQTDYTGGFRVKPVIQNALVDLNLYWGMDEWAYGLFFRIHAPIAWTKWDLGMCVTNDEPGVKDGITKRLVNSNTLDSFLDFSCKGVTPDDVPALTSPATASALKFTPLYYSRLCPSSNTKTRLSDIQADFGWNFLLDDDYHLGLFIRAAAPTGNRPHGQYLFEPIVGNGHHWELGGGLTTHAILWRSETEESKHFGFYVDANITHMFNAKQCRFFDLCQNGAWSRYNLAFKTTEVNGVDTIVYSPVANLTAHEVKVSIGVQADVAAMFNYTSGNFGWDLGYNFWGRSCEKFHCKSDCDSCGKDSRKCSICECPTFYNELDGATWSLAGATEGASYSNATIHAYGDADEEQKFLTQDDLNLNSARTKGISNKIFTHFAYNWYDHEDWIPYLGIGAEVEFGGGKKCCGSDNCREKSCSGCKNTAISQWGIWLKGGASF